MKRIGGGNNEYFCFLVVRRTHGNQNTNFEGLTTFASNLSHISHTQQQQKNTHFLHRLNLISVRKKDRYSQR